MVFLLWKIFGPRREETAGGWEKLYNDKLHYFHTSPNIIRVMRLGRLSWAGYVALHYSMYIITVYTVCCFWVHFTLNCYMKSIHVLRVKMDGILPPLNTCFHV
jgi:hypothetical protein